MREALRRILVVALSLVVAVAARGGLAQTGDEPPASEAAGLAAAQPVIDPGRVVRDQRVEGADPTHVGGWAELTYGVNLPLGDGQHEALVNAALGIILAHTFSQEFSFYAAAALLTAGLDVTLEEAYLDWTLTDSVTIRAGVIVVPMGLANMWHEPISFLPVARPRVSTVIIPSTWSEAAVGVLVQPSDLWSGQLYVISGLNPLGFSVESGIRRGTQDVALARTNGPSFVGRLEVSPDQTLDLGASVYFGLAGPNVRPKLFDGPDGRLLAPSVPILGLSGDVRGAWGGFRATAEAAWFSIGDTAELRRAVAEDNTAIGPDSPASLFGARLELAFDVLSMGSSDQELLVFARGERYDTAASFSGREATDADDAFALTEVGGGVTWRPLLALALKLEAAWREPDGPTDGDVLIRSGGGGSF